ncbi:hypothetical protein H9I48_04020 [Wolbachia pipientis]|uniref:hypothetical protein n=1 Tax=Wolbachia pipientis TaxID=955 RepID=UPI001650E298|nr:hypothetical protein [Wolbachia pipientis]MBC6686387.1 hypothetical protein [Wolbachia pipientis]
MLADEIPRMNRGMTVHGGMTISSSSRCLLAGSIAGIPRMNRGMTVCGGMTVRGGMT